MARSELFHVGIVVPDIEAAAQRFTDLLGIEWGPIIEMENSFRRASGEDVTLPGFKLCYSVSGPHLELIKEEPGTPWVCNEHSNLHHIGFYSDTVAHSSDQLTAARCPLEITGHDPDSDATMWWYHRDPLGVRIEFIDAQIMPVMNEMMFVGGGSIDAPIVPGT
jgi:catechol 2,3-dioxygenase-like lactoylglutathione lyase family enzyme